MNWLIGLLLVVDTKEQLDIPETTATPNKIEHSIETEVTPPDIELLMFLAEWEAEDGEQWLDPDLFSHDDEFNQQLDKIKATDNEKDPDNH